MRMHIEMGCMGFEPFTAAILGENLLGGGWALGTQLKGLLRMIA